MSKKSNSKSQKNKGNYKNASTPTEDPDFWSLETNASEIDTPAEELEEIERVLAEKKLGQPLKSLSEHEPVIEVPCEKEIISSLDLLGESQEVESFSDISNKDVDELLATANAEVKAEQDRDRGIQAPPLPTPKATKEVKKNKYIKSPIEKTATLVCYLAILGVFTYLIIYASKQHNFDTAIPYESNTPAAGEFANIEEVETWWSEPVGNNTKFDVILVPSATITLGPESTSGVIRAVFYSSEEGLLGQLRPKGDPFTHKFVDGKFLESGTNQINIYGTDGFNQLAHFIYYRSQTETRWTIDIKEAPPGKNEVDSFKPLANAPIEPIRK